MNKLKILLLVFSLAEFSLLSSCVFPGPRGGNHGGLKANHGQMKSPENSGHHDNNGHHDK